jgi:hypothetical protein
MLRESDCGHRLVSYRVLSCWSVDLKEGIPNSEERKKRMGAKKIIYYVIKSAFGEPVRRSEST